MTSLSVTDRSLEPDTMYIWIRDKYIIEVSIKDEFLPMALMTWLICNIRIDERCKSYLETRFTEYTLNVGLDLIVSLALLLVLSYLPIQYLTLL